MADKTAKNTIPARKSPGRGQRKHSWFYTVGLILTAGMIGLILIGQIWTPYQPSAMDASAIAQGPSLAHIMGTDSFGRDIFSRIMEGAGSTLLIAFAVVALGAFAGVVIGALTGYFGGVVDEILMRICDAITAFPSVLLALIILAVLGPGKWNVIWVLAILFVPSFARVVRTEFVRIKKQNYISLAKLQGASPARLMLLHMLPNAMPVLLPAITIGFNNAVLAEASMSFLGVGVSASEVSLGRMLSDAQNYILRGLPWYALFVGLTIVLLILGLSLLSEGLQQKAK